MSFPLFKSTLKSCYVVFIIFTALLVFYMFSIAAMYNPSAADAMAEMMEMLPESLVKMMGMSSSQPGLTGFLAGYYYGFLIFAFPMAYLIIVGHRMIGKSVDNGSMAYLISTPNTRVKIAVTQAVFYFLSIFAMFALVCVSGIFICEITNKGLLNIGGFLKLNISAFFLNAAIGSICFFASCLFNEAKHSYAMGAGVPVAFFFLYMVGNLGGRLKWIGYLSPYTLLDSAKILSGETSYLILSAGSAAFAAALTFFAILIFKNKRLPI